MTSPYLQFNHQNTANKRHVKINKRCTICLYIYNLDILFKGRNAFYCGGMRNVILTKCGIMRMYA